MAVGYPLGSQPRATKVAREDSLHGLSRKMYRQPRDLTLPPHAERRITAADRNARRDLCLTVSY
jgi:hypothetical protein